MQYIRNTWETVRCERVACTRWETGSLSNSHKISVIRAKHTLCVPQAFVLKQNYVIILSIYRLSLFSRGQIKFACALRSLLEDRRQSLVILIALRESRKKLASNREPSLTVSIVRQSFFNQLFSLASLRKWREEWERKEWKRVEAANYKSDASGISSWWAAHRGSYRSGCEPEYKYIFIVTSKLPQT